MEIRLARHGRYTAIVSIDNQPRLNAITRQMLSKLGATWDKLERATQRAVAFLTGAGQRAFAAAPISAAMCRSAGGGAHGGPRLAEK
jgi:enoyl-CoA hydratase/carnithine racemase